MVVMAVVLATVGARESAAAETALPPGGGKK
jgi:hypothetical protein